MSLRLEMLQVARLAPKVLETSTDLVRSFLAGQQIDGGAFKDRAGRGDLYYTVFGLDGLTALQTPVPTETTLAYLKTFGGGEKLDFVHLCCLARCWAAVSGRGNPAQLAAPSPEILANLLKFRSADGGFNQTPGASFGTAYGCFLALGVHQDLGGQPPEPSRLVECLHHLRTPDGAWANERHVTTGSTNATAAAITILRHLGVSVEQSAGAWLLARYHSQGGFLATPNAPMPDLLSTATALHALDGMQVSFEAVKEGCLDFVDSLWSNAGGFHGHWGDDELDCEYTFYGLLALGHLSL